MCLDELPSDNFEEGEIFYWVFLPETRKSKCFYTSSFGSTEANQEWLDSLHGTHVDVIYSRPMLELEEDKTFFYFIREYMKRDHDFDKAVQAYAEFVLDDVKDDLPLVVTA